MARSIEMTLKEQIEFLDRVSSEIWAQTRELLCNSYKADNVGRRMKTNGIMYFVADLVKLDLINCILANEYEDASESEDISYHYSLVDTLAIRLESTKTFEERKSAFKDFIDIIYDDYVAESEYNEVFQSLEEHKKLITK